MKKLHMIGLIIFGLGFLLLGRVLNNTEAKNPPFSNVASNSTIDIHAQQGIAISYVEPPIVTLSEESDVNTFNSIINNAYQTNIDHHRLGQCEYHARINNSGRFDVRFYIHADKGYIVLFDDWTVYQLTDEGLEAFKLFLPDDF